ncbi:MAG: 50S ribosomal protein L21 [Chloroflexi bacterium]|nr:50S ribosomal protein L21 [Chloroflexota bacterium]
MTDYAIVRTGGKQYRVRPGDTLEVEKLDGNVGDSVTLGDVLLASLDGKVAVGTPTIPRFAVIAEIAGQGKGEKVTIFKYKAKTRYRRKRGHRQNTTTLLVKSVGAAPAAARLRTTRSRKKAEA